jgi:ubiquinone biosynthesis protein COQ9
MSRNNQELRDLILLAILPHVVFEGWSKAAAAAGIDDLDIMPKIEKGTFELAFPGGMSDLAAHFSCWADRCMISEMAKLDMASLKIRERIAAGVRCRVKVLSPHREAVRRCLTFLALPSHAGMSLKCTYNTVSEIWYAIGDQSTDFSFYSKRALLAPVLGSTILYWLADEGDGQGDFPDTWAFLDRRIADVLNFFQAQNKLNKRLSKLPKPFSICERFISAVRARG